MNGCRTAHGHASRPLQGAALVALLLAAPAAHALTVEITQSDPSAVGESRVFAAVVTEANGAATYEWTFGDGDPQVGGATMPHTFPTPGLVGVGVSVKDASGDSSSDSILHLVHHPLTANRPTSANSIVYDPARKRVYSVNQDNDTVTSIDANKLEKLAEVEVYRRPESLALTPNGKLWVVHRDDYAVAIVDPERFVVEGGFRLPYASQPVAVAMSPMGDAAYVALMAVGKVLKLNPRSGEVMGEVVVGGRPRGLAVSHDGKDVYVTRFIASDAGGEVVKVDAAAMKVASNILLPIDTQTVDSDQRSRGVPNYLFSVTLTPDGRQAWIPGKKDNIGRGKLRDDKDLTHDTTVRPLASIIDTAKGQELYDSRIDLDDRSQPVHVEFSPFGNFAILALAGSNRLEIRDVNHPTDVFSALVEAGTFPRASVLAPDGRLFVQAALSRTVVVYDLSTMLREFAKSTPPRIADIEAVSNDRTPPEVLLGKQIFHNAADRRMANEGYLSCGSCHFEGDDDGRVYDFTTRGEGLRNTPALIGRKGMAQGRLNWSGTLDEVQDFEHQIREFFGGKGFLPEEGFHTGTRDQPLGDPKAGVSPELDALSAYVTSLDHVNPSPYRNPDGSLTADGVAGKALFQKLGCDFCHGGPDFTDSMRGMLHDVGTMTPLSGKHAGGPLLGIDTPTLLGVWETPPYLHDGSAATLRDVLVARNGEDRHGYVSALDARQVDQLVAYLQQIDDERPVRRFPFDPVWVPPVSGGVVDGLGEHPPVVGTCSCEVPISGGGASATGLVGLGMVALVLRRRPGRRRPGGNGVRAAALLFLLLGGCVPGPPSGGSVDRQPTVWSTLPAPTHVDPELMPLGTRLQTRDRICGRGRADAFARALCGGAERPEIRDMAELLELVGLDGEGTAPRAFALTGNSTSLVAMSVSAVNPRILVFPRVGGDLRPPEKMTAVGFVRGEPFVELVSRDLVTGDLNFYLLSFEKKCSFTSSGCGLADVLTEDVENEWAAYSVYDHEDLEGTSFDCRSCHQPKGYGTKHILRMQELASPWMHWFPQRFSQRTDSDRALVAQFAEAHQSERQYGGVPVDVITNAVDEGSGAQLEALLRAEGHGDQPNAFDAQIATEMVAGTSVTWQARFQAHLAGEAIAVPYPRVDVTDEAKRRMAVRAFQDVVRQAAPRQTMVDLRPIFSDDAIQKLSFVPQTGADGKTVLLQMCSRCHDGRGNPRLAKNLFNVRKLDEMSRAAKELAIVRLNESGAKRMPPWRSGVLGVDAIRAATLVLQQ